MPKIQRATQKIFGGNAESDQLAVFGSMITGTPVYNDDIETLQSEAYTEGWQVAVAANEAPFMEEMNGVQYGFSKQLAYLFQQGIPEWDAGTTYYLNSFCQVGGVIYKSMQDENINHSPADDSEGTYWTPLETGGGGGLEVCDIGMALYVDETKGLRRRLNGTTVSVNTNTQAFVNKLKSIAALYPSLACTETEWSQIESASDLGQVGKFVIQDAEEIQYYAYSSGSTTYLTTSTEDSDSVNVYNTEFVLQGTGSISSDVLTYESQTYNRASGSDTTQEVEAYVRLPKVINVQGLIDLQNLGVTVAAGLPNITGQVSHIACQTSSTNLAASGAFDTTRVGGGGNGTNNDSAIDSFTLDASRSSSVYGNSTTVQPEAIQYPYFIQIATGQETEVNITNEIELNNPYTLFDSKYSPDPLYNASWLKSDGEYKPKTTYVTAYEALVVEQNSAVEAGTSVQLPSGTTYVKRGLSVKLSTAEDITDYDFVINTTDETFRLPLKNGLEGVFAGQTVVGNGMTLGLTNGTQFGGLIQGGDGQGTSLLAGIVEAYGKNVGSYTGNTALDVPSNVGVATDSTKSGLVTSNSVPDGFALYYYVGETVQNANLIDAGRMPELYATKQYATSASFPSDRYIDLTLGASGSTYTAPADGWVCCEKEAGTINQYVSAGEPKPGMNGTVYSERISYIASYSSSTALAPCVFFPVRKGSTYFINYSASGDTLIFRFIYAQGAQGGS